ncbi:hypothetical protein MSAN_01832300 [Mycena sanguinolenta]|uniref:Uncharacterized protein n=1 Tax=Mycena sanguinolenta TaxID=230812 RepID=A0A8H7CRY6_9AGAR|nr:hypothetical protein MSAN_01832300 [Mycena sanguinolenta]
MASRSTQTEHTYQTLGATDPSPMLTRTDHELPSTALTTPRISTSSTFPNKRHRNRRNNPSEPATQNASFADRNRRMRAQTSGGSGRPTKRVKKAASRNDGPPDCNHSASIHAAAEGSRARDARSGSNSQVDTNTKERIEFPYVSVTGGIGGVGGAGGVINGNGGNAMGPVFNVRNMHFHF